MKILLIPTLFLELILTSLCQIAIWDLKNSSSDLLGENNNFEYTIYDETKDGYHLILKKTITKYENGDITQENILKINDEEYPIKWEGIQNFYNLNNQLYICPTGKNFLNIFENGQFKEDDHHDGELTEDWDFICYYQEYRKILFISYLNSNDINIYGLRINNQKWFSLAMHAGYLDIIWPKNINNDIYKIFNLVLKTDSINLGKVEITIRENTQSSNMINLAKMEKKLNETFAFFDEDNYAYWITHDEHYFISGYTTEPLNDFENQKPVEIHFENHPNSPFEFLEDIKINYLNFIRNTKFAYYEIEDHNKIYHGVIDIKMNKIIFNTNEEILDFKPYSKNSLLIITNSSAYQLCTIPSNKGCLDECKDGEILILDPENGNHCGLKEECPNYIFKPSGICIDECNSTFYVVQNDTDELNCGLCKNLYKNKKYKLINEDFCIEEKPENTYFYNEQYYLLNYCHESCKTCFGDKSNECLSCKDKIVLENGKCENCEVGYYKDNDNNCQKCNDTCLTCSGQSEDNNNKCLECDPDSEYPYLVDAEGFGKNCVKICPEKTILNNETRHCIIEKDDDDDNDGFKWWYWLIIIIIILLLIILIFILYRKCRNKKSEDLTETMDKELINGEITK